MGAGDNTFLMKVPEGRHDPPCPFSMSKFIQLQNWNSRKLNIWAKLLSESKVGSLLLVINNKCVLKAL